MIVWTPAKKTWIQNFGKRLPSHDYFWAHAVWATYIFKLSVSGKCICWVCEIAIGSVNIRRQEIWTSSEIKGGQAAKLKDKLACSRCLEFWATVHYAIQIFY